ncbi:hypothetical protein [Segetibacter sp. 3557_3]|nr:hypothetical protein [Segetibacter sp. 3557_3]
MQVYKTSYLLADLSATTSQLLKEVETEWLKLPSGSLEFSPGQGKWNAL